jgi:hypothetical protein
VRRQGTRLSKAKIVVPHLRRHQLPPLAQESLILVEIIIKDGFRDCVHAEIGGQTFDGVDASVFQWATRALLVQAREVFLRRTVADANVDLRLHIGVIRHLVVVGLAKTVFLEVVFGKDVVDVAFVGHEVVN